MRRATLVLLGVLLVTSCDQRRNAKRTPSPTAPDRSHSTQEALEAGAPTIAKPWTPPDYVAFDAYLGRIPVESYPRMGSMRSGELFRKLVESVDQDIFRNGNIDIDHRMGLGLQMQQALNNILKRYVVAHTSGTDYSTELAYLQGITLSVVRQILELVDEFWPTIDPNDGKYEVRMHGLQTMKNGIATQMTGLILTLQETRTYSDADRRILCEYLAEHGSDVLDHLDPIVRFEFEIKVQNLKASERDSGVRDLLTRFLSSLPREGAGKPDAKEG